MPPNFCPNCGTRVEDHYWLNCAKCGYEFSLDDDLVIDEDEDELFADDDNEFDDADDDFLLAPYTDPITEHDDPTSAPIVDRGGPWEKHKASCNPDCRPRHIIVTVLLWFAFVPAGILGGLIVGVLAYLFLGSSAWLIGLPFNSPWNLMLAVAACGYVSVLFAAHAAPIHNKVIPAIVMATVLLVLYGATIAVSFHQRDWFNIVLRIVGSAAVAVATYQVIKETRTKADAD